MSQEKLPLINSAHGSDTRNIINEMIRLFNSMGYTYEEALNKAHDVLEEAKKTNDENKLVQQQINTLIAESGTSDAELIQARIDAEGNEFSVVKERLDHNDGIRKSHGESIDAHDRALDYYWVPELQPAARTDRQPHFVDGYSGDVNNIYENYLDPYVQQHPDYASRMTHGKDASGAYDVHTYFFTPENYKNTVIITTALHGSEKTSLFSMLRFLHYLMNESDKHPLLSKFKKETKLIYTPIANPYGYANDVRQNSNGVDLNRNWDYNFDSYAGDPNPFDQNYKGTAPFSEVETQYIKSLIDDHGDGAIFLDFHNTGTNTFTYYIEKPDNFKYGLYDKLLHQFTKDLNDPVIVDNNTSGPTAMNYAYNVRGVIASVVEWCDRNYSPTQTLYDQAEITKSLEWFSNVIFENIREFGEKDIKVYEKRYAHGGNPIEISSTNTLELPMFKRAIPINFDGLAVYEGHITVRLMSGAGAGYFIPMLGQYGNGTGHSYNDIRTGDWEAYAMTGGDVRTNIPFRAVIPIKPTNLSNGIEELSVGMAGKVDGNAVYRIQRFHSTLKLIPSKNAYHDFETIRN